jgi:transcriptional regulator with XRE-family HTH domain
VARPENSLEYTSTGELYRGSRIRELRWKKGLSREKMAELLRCDPDSLSNVETNGVNPSQQMLSKICKLLEVPLEHFTQAPVHPRILRKKAAQAVAQPRLASPLASRPSTKQPPFAAGIASEEDMQGFALVKIKEDEAEKKGDQISDTSIPSIAHAAKAIPYMLLGTKGKEIEEIKGLIASARLTDEEEGMVTSVLVETAKRLLSFIETQRKTRKES